MASSRELFILSLIARRPTYGYEIKQFLSDANAEAWANISTPHIYHTLSKLEKAGLIEARQERNGCQPTREVYSITRLGQANLTEMLQQDQFLDQSLTFDFDVVLAAVGGLRDLSDEDKTRVIKRRIQIVENAMRTRKEMKSAGKVSKWADTPLVQAIGQHKSRFLEMELTWLQEILHTVERTGWRAFAGIGRKHVDSPESLVNAVTESDSLSL